MRGWLAGLVVAALATAPAKSVVILDSTWKQEGGSEQHPALGFSAHIALADQPQFASTIAFTSDGDTYSTNCTGVWIGNDVRHGYVLTAAHCFDDMPKSTVYAYRTTGGTVLTGEALWIHPLWQPGAFDVFAGYDLAIIRLSDPVTDAGPPPVLYAGSREMGRLLTFVGAGMRGIGSIGPNSAYYDAPDDASLLAAGQARIDEVVDAQPRGDDRGNYLSIFLPREDGRIPHPLDGPTKPATRLAGLLAQGDSGAPAWVQSTDRRWLLVGIGASGTGEGRYGDLSWFIRVSYHRDWIRSIVPRATFADDPS